MASKQAGSCHDRRGHHGYDGGRGSRFSGFFFAGRLPEPRLFNVAPLTMPIKPIRESRCGRRNKRLVNTGEDAAIQQISGLPSRAHRVSGEVAGRPRPCLPDGSGRSLSARPRTAGRSSGAGRAQIMRWRANRLRPGALERALDRVVAYQRINGRAAPLRSTSSPAFCSRGLRSLEGCVDHGLHAGPVAEKLDVRAKEVLNFCWIAAFSPVINQALDTATARLSRNRLMASFRC